jgi:hypothetical protein
VVFLTDTCHTLAHTFGRQPLSKSAQMGIGSGWHNGGFRMALLSTCSSLATSAQIEETDDERTHYDDTNIHPYRLIEVEAAFWCWIFPPFLRLDSISPLRAVKPTLRESDGSAADFA